MNRLDLREFETYAEIRDGDRVTACNVCGKLHKENHGIRFSYEFSDDFGAGIWNVCNDCEKKVLENIKELLSVLKGET